MNIFDILFRRKKSLKPTATTLKRVSDQLAPASKSPAQSFAASEIPCQLSKHDPKVVVWLVVRQGPQPSNESRYLQQLINHYDIARKTAPNCVGTLVADVHAQINNDHFLAALLIKYASEKNIQYDSGSVQIDSYNDGDGYKGVLITAKEAF